MTSDGQRLLGWPLAAGVALFMARQNERPLSFRREEFEPKETAEVVSLLSAVAVALLGVVLLVGGFMLQLGAQKARAISQAMEDNVKAFWDREFPVKQRNRPAQPPLNWRR